MNGRHWLRTLIGTLLLPMSLNAFADCTLYDAADYAGSVRSLSAGERLGSLGSWDNKLSSVDVTPNCKLTVYADSNFRGDTKTVTGTLRHIGSLWDNQTSSAVCACTLPPRPQYGYGHWRHEHTNFAPPPPPPPAKRCTVFRDMNFGGASLALNANTRHEILGYNMNDQTSSVKVPQGCTLNVYSKEGLFGRSKLFAEGDYNFVGEIWDDRISSAECTCH